MNPGPSYRNSDAPTTVTLCSFPPCAKRASHKTCCSKCKVARYCKRGHQVADAQRHQSECTPTPSATFPETRRVSVLLFPPSQTAPKIAQVDCLIRQDSETPEEELHSINWPSLLGQNAAFTSQPVSPREPSSPHPSRLYLAFNDCFAIDGSPLNLCAARLTEGSSGVLWRGTLVGYRAREPASTFTQFRDVSMDDLPAFAAFLKTYGASPSQTRMPSNHGLGDVEEPDLWSFTEEPSGMPLGSGHPFSRPSADFTQARQTELVRDTIREEFIVMRAELRMLLQKEVAYQVWVSFLNIVFRGVVAYIWWDFVSTIFGYAYYLVFDTWFGCFLIVSSLVRWCMTRSSESEQP